MRPGISCSASSISLRPKSASERSATLKSPSAPVAAADDAGFVLVMAGLLWGSSRGADLAETGRSDGGGRASWSRWSRPGSPGDSHAGPDQPKIVSAHDTGTEPL